MSHRPGHPQPSWWSRNWGWAVPVGCIALIIVPLGCCGTVGITLYQKVRGGLTSSELFVESLARIEAHPEASAALGTPIEPGWFMQGRVQLSDTSGEVDISVPVTGPNGRGTLHIVAEKSAGTWMFHELVLEMAGDGPRIELISAGETGIDSTLDHDATE